MHSPRLLLATLLTVSLARDGPMVEVRSRRGRWLVALLVVGVALDLIVGLALGYVAVQARSAASQAHLNKVAAYEACLANNDNKMADAQRWREVLALVSDGGSNPQTAAFVRGVEKANAAADAPRDCNRIAP